LLSGTMVDSLSPLSNSYYSLQGIIMVERDCALEVNVYLRGLHPLDLTSSLGGLLALIISMSW
jgi:hypothetical protein